MRTAWSDVTNASTRAKTLSASAAAAAAVDSGKTIS